MEPDKILKLVMAVEAGESISASAALALLGVTRCAEGLLDVETDYNEKFLRTRLFDALNEFYGD